MVSRFDEFAADLHPRQDNGQLNGDAQRRRVRRRSPKRDLVLQLLQQSEEGLSSAEIVQMSKETKQPLNPSTVTSVLSTEARFGRLEYVDGRYRLPPADRVIG